MAPLRLFGQEINPTTFAMARMNAFIHDMEAEIALGDTMRRPAFTAGDGGLQRFDLVTANPMWNQNFPTACTRTTPSSALAGAFRRPPAPIGAGCSTWWLRWPRNGRMAVVLDTGRGLAGQRQPGLQPERDIRKLFVEGDLVTEAWYISCCPRTCSTTPPPRAL